MASHYSNPQALVTGDWLESQLSSDRLRIVDAGWFMPDNTDSGQLHYQRHHIPGACFFDIQALSDPDSQWPHMLPAPPSFHQAMQSFDIAPHHHIIVYDAHGLMSAGRAWWMLRLFGYDHVSILDGGWPLWQQQGRPHQSTTPPLHASPSDPIYYPDPHLKWVWDREGLIEAHGSIQIIDARSPGRFNGVDPEPHQKLRSGHIDGSINIYYSDLTDDAGRLLKADELHHLFAQAFTGDKRPIVTSCGSGITACTLVFALHMIGHDAGVYDGSWAQWGAVDASLIR